MKFIILLILLESSFGFSNKTRKDSMTTTKFEHVLEIHSTSLGSNFVAAGSKNVKNLTTDRLLKSNNVSSTLASAQQKMIKKLRSKIQKVFSKIKSDAQMYDHMFHIFERHPEERNHILSHLEDIIHQYDVGRDFAKKGGLKVLLSAFNSSDENILASSLLVMGSALQGNPDVQDIAYDLRLDKPLIICLSHNSSLIISRSLYAISSYLRQSPVAQERFLKTGGFHSLLNTLNNSNVSLKLKMKVVNIINDLVIEQQEAFQNSDKINEESNVLKHYNNLNIEEELKRVNFCSIIPQFLYEDDFDIHQKIVAAMNTLFPICGDKYSNKTTYLRIVKLLKQYDSVADVEMDADLTLSLHKDLSVLLGRIPKLKESQLNDRKDEL